eukprot:scaffold37392_cov33-Tisochrysis_lutea.AAC.1
MHLSTLRQGRQGHRLSGRRQTQNVQFRCQPCLTFCLGCSLGEQCGQLIPLCAYNAVCYAFQEAFHLGFAHGGHVGGSGGKQGGGRQPATPSPQSPQSQNSFQQCSLCVPCSRHPPPHPW